VKGSKRGERGCFFAPHQLPHVHANHALSPFAEKKIKKSAEMGPRTQCWPTLCFKILMPAGTWIKFLSAGLKIGVPAGTVLKN
jgi:hypothetical protein